MMNVTTPCGPRSHKTEHVFFGKCALKNGKTLPAGRMIALAADEEAGDGGVKIGMKNRLHILPMNAGSLKEVGCGGIP